MGEKREIEEIFSKAVRAGRRTYFFDVRSTRAGDYYLTMTESKRDFNEDGTIECKYYYIDTDVLNGIEYTYSVVSYDMGLPDSTQVTANPDSLARPNGYQHIESSKGSTTLDANFVTVIPGAQNTGDDCNSVRVIPNPYFG